MKIKSLLILSVICTIGFISCNDLDLEPKGQFGEADFLGSESGVQTFFAGIYGWLPLEDFLYSNQDSRGYRNNNNDDGRDGDAWGTWESPKNTISMTSGEYVGGNQVNNNGPNYWRYNRVRDINTFINNFEKYKNLYSGVEGLKKFNELLGEARFLRAFIYSGMVKRYGGVPIITEVQDPVNGDPETLNVKRNTEYEVYKFIYEDLKFASENMTSVANKYRGTKWTALALQSRMMLYAATNAKYSRYLNYAGEEAYDKGFAGISADKADEFFKYSYDASKELIEKGPYELYKEHSDLAYNFERLFLDINSKETIFFKNYVHHDAFEREAFLIGHNWDALMLPNTPRNPMSNFVGSQAYPSLTDMQRFEGFPNLVAEDGTPKRWDHLEDIKANMEPRLRGSVFFVGDEFQGIKFDIRRGIYRTFTWPASAIVDGVSTEVPNANGNRVLSNNVGDKFRFNASQAASAKNITVLEDTDGKFIYNIGEHGMRDNSGAENNCLTGAYVRKYINPDMTKGRIVEHASFQPWIAFRLGEIYLNIAEAAYELGNKEEANTYIHKIRERAGCKNLDISNDLADVNAWDYDKSTIVYPMEIGLQFIRDERYRELWGEAHRWWDLRRWRVADRILENFRPRILGSYYILDEDKFIYLDEREMGNRTYNASRTTCYYQAIPAGEINKNPNLLPQNPFR